MASRSFKIRGKDNFLKNDEAKNLRTTISKKMDIEEFDAKADSSSDIKHALFGASFLRDKQGVFIRNADKMDQSVAESFVEDPPAGRLAVFIQSDQSRVKKWFRELDVGKTIKVKKPKRWKIPGWIQKRARSMGMRISEQDAETIQEYSGTELYVLNNELRKLSLYTGGGDIKQDQIADVLVRHDDVSMFSICEQWGLANHTSAVERLGTFRRMGGQAVGFIHVMMNHVEKMLLSRSLYDKGDRGGDKIRSELGVPPFIWRNKIRPQVKARQQAKLADAQELLLDIEIRSKSGEDPWPLLELFLLDT